MKKKENILDASIKLDKLGASWDEHPAVQWIMQNGLNLFFALLALLAVLFLIFRFTAIGKEKKEMDFWTADKEFRTFASPAVRESDPLEGQEALTILKSLMNEHPELNAKYDALIAQILLIRGDTGEALPFANVAVQRTEEENAPFYADYAKTTLLIAEMHYDQAFQNAVTLDKKMREAFQQNLTANIRKFGDTLFAFNLFRIGVLQEKLGLKKEELKTWQEWKQFLQGTQYPTLAKAFQEQNAIFSEGTLSLLDYINHREQALATVRK